MLKKTLCLIFFLNSLLLVASAKASDFPARGPLPFRPQNPIYLEFAGLRPERAVSPTKGAASFAINNTYSSIFEWGIGPAFEELIDIELLHTTLNLDLGVGHNMELGLELPFLRLDEGFLDAFIQKYHNTFGFPNAGRDRVPNNSFTYRVTSDETTLYDVGKEALGAGDVALRLKHNFLEEGERRPAAAWLVSFKLPTGDRGEGLGNGNLDFGLGGALEKSHGRWHGYLNMGYFVAGGHRSLEGYYHPVWFAYSLAGEVNLSKPISAVVQIAGGTPILKGGRTSKWDGFPMDLVVGVRGDFKFQISNLKFKELEWHIGFAEDVNPEGPSGDFSVIGGVGIKFGGEKRYKGDWWAGRGTDTF